eukprot:7729556-Lingulodinium_polyedra.AAC.1
MGTDDALYAFWRLVELLCVEIILGVCEWAEDDPLALLAAGPGAPPGPGLSWQESSILVGQRPEAP